MQREDGRGATECRPTFLRKDVVSGGATGSAYGEFARTRVVVSVFGPRPKGKGDHQQQHGPGVDLHGMELDCQVHLPFEGRDAARSGKVGASTAREERERVLGRQLEQSILPSIQQDRLPKTCLEIQCTILESDGNDIGAAIVCASFALATSGIPLYDLVTSCTLACVGNQLVVDPTQAELDESEAEMSLAYMPSRGQVNFVHACGDWSEVSFKDHMDAGVNACKKAHALVKKSLVATVQTK
ncbi:exosome complex exonuclease [Chloropicon primus]|uniref:Exosome complex exonuclease n=1 Tax=Chloropicon primus TaxID=1764295 RepID=A0A5B8MQM6_9CHLO|nr:exosome complex exonuclease [Chloropicon primus]UPR01530.1 exosome complex exonuclease [Chloropicon primus]|eukprot:QDZ22314.1 exosome complex exonuclease [Chloropicon primus]